MHEKELAQNRDIKCTLAEVTKARSTLEQRFRTLSSNHEELIRIKDEYKTDNQVLWQENVKLRSEKEERVSEVSEVLQEKEKQLCTLRETVRNGEERVRGMVGRCTILEEEVRRLEREGKERESAYKEEVERECRQRAGVHETHTEHTTCMYTHHSELIL